MTNQCVGCQDGWRPGECKICSPSANGECDPTGKENGRVIAEVRSASPQPDGSALHDGDIGCTCDEEGCPG